ncbi:MAG: response regulator transcription factor [Clostridiales bacterium]|jgi:DNA-binding response OmpR family regulator|nr:response regulator transcription factor [Clostridiales bacterium]
MEYTILICDDDEDILNALEIYLRQENYAVLRAVNGREAVEIVRDKGAHLVILDVMMPEMDGIRAAVKIREFSNLPIIFLSAKSEDTDRILGLNMGGDDYIAKPFNPVELAARVRAALRRYARLGGIPGQARNDGNVFRTGGLVLDDDRKLVTVDGDEVGLTAIEYNILRLLISNQDRVFSSDQIYEAVWNEPAFHVAKTVSVHIRHIRKKIEINPKEPRYLKVVYGLGYKVVSLE